MWMVLAEIPQEISVPIGLPVVESKLTDAMAPTMNEDGVRAVQNLPASVSQPTTEIYVLEPDREEAFIETASVFPRLSLDGQASACRLLNLLGSGVVETDAAIVPIPWITWPDPVH
jgi:hypothetical protein